MFKIIRSIIICIICLVVMGISVLYGFSSLFAPSNMDETLIPDAASQFYDINGNAIYTTLSEERRVPVTIDKIPKHLQQAFIAIEDNRFYEHGGIDYRGTARALSPPSAARKYRAAAPLPSSWPKMRSSPRNVPSPARLRKLSSPRNWNINILKMKSLPCT